MLLFYAAYKHYIILAVHIDRFKNTIANSLSLSDVAVSNAATRSRPDANTLPWTFATNKGLREQLNQLWDLSLNSSIKRAYSSVLLSFLTFISMSGIVFQSNCPVVNETLLWYLLLIVNLFWNSSTQLWHYQIVFKVSYFTILAQVIEMLWIIVTSYKMYSEGWKRFKTMTLARDILLIRVSWNNCGMYLTMSIFLISRFNIKMYVFLVPFLVSKMCWKYL